MMPTDRRRFLRSTLAAGAFLAARAGGASENSETTNADNRIVLELPPRDNNPRNSEGAFVTLGDGRILFAYTHFYGDNWRDDATARICGRISTDSGLTWSKEDRVLVENDGQQNVMSVSLLRLADTEANAGRIALFYLIKNGFHDCRPRLRASSDDGETWSAPDSVIPAPGYFVVNNDRLVQLSTGRLVVPASFHRAKTESPHDWKTFDSRGIAMFFLSDDVGKTWREAKNWWALPVSSGSGLQEPGVVELRDGRLYAFCRTDTGRQWELRSEDGGETWSSPKESQFQSPTSPLSMKRIPTTGDLLAVWNDRPERYNLPKSEKASWGRTPLAAAISRDDGKTWENHRLLEDDPESGYCYTAIHFTDDAALLAYCAGGRDGEAVLQRLRVRRVGLDWFYA